jgi:hypothetical protein
MGKEGIRSKRQQLCVRSRIINKRESGVQDRVVHRHILLLYWESGVGSEEKGKTDI